MTKDVTHDTGMLATIAIESAASGLVRVCLAGVSTPFTFVKVQWHDEDTTYLLQGIDEHNLSVWFPASAIVAVLEVPDI